MAMAKRLGLMDHRLKVNILMAKNKVMALINGLMDLVLLEAGSIIR
jgi:hypothetical protein